METDRSVTDEVRQLSARVDMLFSIVQSLAQSIRATQEPMTIPDFAERVGLSVSRVRRMVREGDIKTKGRKIPPTELLRFGI
jgi:hypothetical protein